MNKMEAEKFCKAWLASWSGNQPEKLLSFYAEDCFYSDPVHPEGLRGIPALRKYFVRLLAKYPDWKWDLIELSRTGEIWFVKWKALVPKEKGPVSFMGLDRVEIKNGKIAFNEVYFDPRSLLS